MIAIRFNLPGDVIKNATGSIVNCPITKDNVAVGFIHKADRETGACEGMIYADLAPEFLGMGELIM